MKVIFLDIDGVLNNQSWLNSRLIGDVFSRNPGDDLRYFCPDLVANLQRIVEATGAQVVLSSSWRYFRTPQDIENLISQLGFKVPILDYTPLNHERWEAIDAWLKGHPEVRAYVALDDANQMGYDGVVQVKTDFKVGLGPEETQKAIEILTRVDDLPRIIRFYTRNGAWGCFTNFSNHPIVYDGLVWPTSEHLYQAMKFNDPELREQIRLCSTPTKAAALGRTPHPSAMPMASWDAVKFTTMLGILAFKFTQNKDARDVLLCSGNAILVEDSPVDWFWGCGADQKGLNKLGYALMSIRNELRNNALQRVLDKLSVKQL